MYNDISKIIGETIVSIKGAEEWSDRITFRTKSGREFLMHHSQD